MISAWLAAVSYAEKSWVFAQLVALINTLLLSVRAEVAERQGAELELADALNQRDEARARAGYQAARAREATAEAAELRRGVAGVVSMLRAPRSEKADEEALPGLLGTALSELLVVGESDGAALLKELAGETARADDWEKKYCDLYDAIGEALDSGLDECPIAAAKRVRAELAALLAADDAEATITVQRDRARASEEALRKGVTDIIDGVYGTPAEPDSIELMHAALVNVLDSVNAQGELLLQELDDAGERAAKAEGALATRPDRGTLINAAASAGARLVDAQHVLDRTPHTKVADHERARVAAVDAKAKKAAADAALKACQGQDVATAAALINEITAPLRALATHVPDTRSARAQATPDEVRAAGAEVAPVDSEEPPKNDCDACDGRGEFIDPADPGRPCAACDGTGKLCGWCSEAFGEEHVCAADNGDYLDANLPIAVVDAAILKAGGDPVAIAKEGAAFVATLLEERATRATPAPFVPGSPWAAEQAMRREQMIAREDAKHNERAQAVEAAQARRAAREQTIDDALRSALSTGPKRWTTLDAAVQAALRLVDIGDESTVEDVDDGIARIGAVRDAGHYALAVTVDADANVAQITTAQFAGSPL